MSMQYRCSSCHKSVIGHDKHVLRQLPAYLQTEFPAILSHASGISTRLADLMRPFVQNSVGPKRMVKILRELHLLRHDRLEMQYLSAVKDSMELESHSIATGQRSAADYFSPTPASSTRATIPVLAFSAFADKSHYNGWVPTATYLRTAYTAMMDDLRPCMDKEMMVLDGKVLKGDHSFKLVKRLARIKGKSVFSALYTMCNEYEEVRMQLFVPSKSHSNLLMPFQELRKAYQLYGHIQPEFFFTDNVNSDKGFLQKLLPSLCQGVRDAGPSSCHNMAVLTVPDEVHISVIVQSPAMENVVNLLLAESETEQKYIGFSCVWSDEVSEKLSIIRLSCSSQVYIFKFRAHDRLPSALVQFLETNAIIKVGSKLGVQFAKLTRAYGASCCGSLEIGSYCRERGLITSDSLNLGDICAAVLHRQLLFHHSDDLRKWSITTLTQASAKNAAVIPWAFSAIYEASKVYPVLNRRIIGNAVPGTHVAWCPATADRQAAYGTIVSMPTHPSTRNSRGLGRQVDISISQILVPARIVEFDGRALQDFGPLPFQITVLQSELRTWRPVESTPEESQSISVDIPLPWEGNITFSDVSDVSELSSSDSDSDSSLDSPVPSVTNQWRPSQDMSSTSSSSDVVSNIGNDVNGVDFELLPTRVLKDIFHLMDMVKVSKRHSASKEFSWRFRDAIFVCDEEDRQRVEAFLTSKGDTWENKMRSNPSWVLHRVRRLVPPPAVLHQIVKDLFEAYGTIICSNTGLPLFDDSTKQRAENVLKAIAAGHVSDPPGISFYFEMGKDKAGLPLYRCSRGTNSVEGGIHQNIIRKFGSFGASPHLADCVLADYRLRHNIDVSSVVPCDIF